MKYFNSFVLFSTLVVLVSFNAQSVSSATCGNGLVEPGEACDDNNAIANDGCFNCTVETYLGWDCTNEAGKPSKCQRCGNSVLEIGEVCDDGNRVSGDGCSSNCKTIENGFSCVYVGGPCEYHCGDGQTLGTEDCDDGNTISGDGCSSTCTEEIGWNCNTASPSVCNPICGDGIVKGTEQCDDGNTANGDGCNSCIITNGYSCNNGTNCYSGCQDGLRAAYEQCDDHNSNNGDGCSKFCVQEYGWSCTGAVGAQSICTEECGNGIKTTGEQCDDHNTNNNDGCSSTCTIEVGWNCTADQTGQSRCQKCGNGIVEYGEECDGGSSGNNGCDASCHIKTNLNYTCITNSTGGSTCSICGNSVKDGLEQCDDGNHVSNDGCSSACLKEVGYDCNIVGSPCTPHCGDSIVIAPEECDEVSDYGCNSCKVTRGWYCTDNGCDELCGNYYITTTEGCDDGNLADDDGCSSDCKIEYGWGCPGNLTSLCTPTCGDGYIIGGEACDDNNKQSGDGCSSTCEFEAGFNCTRVGNSTFCVPICGDGLFIPNKEQCDDENLNNGDGCSSNCTIERGWNCNTGVSPSDCYTSCGDGVRMGTEECDDNGNVGGDGCSETCTVESGWTCVGALGDRSDCTPICGDGIVKSQEPCDDHNTIAGDGCSPTCTVEVGWSCSALNSTTSSVCRPTCGDGIIILPEECDDGNIFGSDGCNGSCIIDAGWKCDPDPSSPTNRSICTPICGNGQVIRPIEECDDGNLDNGDGCSSVCAEEPGWNCGTSSPSDCQSQCGDGFLVNLEICDDGNTQNGDGCSQDCDVEFGWECTSDYAARSICTGICEDGLVTPDEQCDDNNTVLADGCSNCTVDAGWRCFGSPSNCSEIVDPPQTVIGASSDSSTVVAAVVPTVLALILLGAAIVFILYRRNARRGPKKPNFETIAFGTDGTTPVADPITPEKRQTLETMEQLLLEKDMFLVSALCDVTQSTEIDKVSKFLIYLFYKHHQAVDLLRYRVVREIESSESENTLFRQNSFASKMFTTYSKLIGLDYLWDTLGLIMFELNLLGTGNANTSNVKAAEGQKSLLGHASIEVDPNKMKDDEDSLANQLQLQLLAHKIWKAVVDSEGEIPSDFRGLFSHIVTEMPKKYSDRSAVYKAVGGFFFLRFICPSLTTPHVYGLLKDPPAEGVQRYVVLLSKVLQSIANGTLPGKKEGYMEVMNDFISSHIKDGEQFFERISQPPPEGSVTISVAQYSVPQAAYDNALLFLHKHILTSMNKLNAALDGHPRGEELKPKLRQLMN